MDKIFFLFLSAFQVVGLFFSSQDLCAYIYPYETPIVQHLKTLNITEFDTGIEKVDCIYIINLDTRPEKWERVIPQFIDRGLKFNRVSGVVGSDLSESQVLEMAGFYQRWMKVGHIGCLLSHISVLKDAYNRDVERIWVMEDDAEVLEDPHQISDILSELEEIDSDWDILYTDTDMRDSTDGYLRFLALDSRPDQKLQFWYYLIKRTQLSKNIMKIGQRYGTHSFLISRKGMKKMLDHFTHVYLWSAIDIDMHYIPNIREYSTTRDIVSNFRITTSDTAN